ncbi:FecR domain-containing protein [Fulvivirgaceae bacterium BMA10]|uniref:FecR domain-containing protein n=1 Tax=Splendidivirga corallicola TaxID=3051826 RepID=A0ABT8KS54_9BACT|nr:FecR domain-containing protein [Fulvivirgaceae bacterium BMA10]
MNKNIFFELVTKVLSGEATKCEQELFDSYMIDPEYRNLYEWLKKEWYKEIRHPVAKFDYAKSLEKLRTKIRNAEQEEQRTLAFGMPFEKRTLYIAASVVIFLAIGFLGKTLLYNQDFQKQPHFLSYKTERGERKLIELPDGSKVHLNAETTIQYPSDFSGKERKINLSGEAFFSVKRDTKRPFIVNSGDVSTTVLGTSFNVSAFTGNNTYVTVESGKVKVANEENNSEIILTKGEQAIYDKSMNAMDKMVVNIGAYTDWRNGFLHFNETTLKQAIEQMEKWYDVTIECDEQTLLERNIRGVYQNESLHEVLEDMQFMFELKYEFVNDSLIMITE